MEENKFDKLVALVEEMKADAAKFFDKGTDAAGARLRQGTLNVEKVAKELRQQIQTIRNNK